MGTLPVGYCTSVAVSEMMGGLPPTSQQTFQQKPFSLLTSDTSLDAGSQNCAKHMWQFYLFRKMAIETVYQQPQSI